MGFRDFITNRWFRRQLEADFERQRNIRPPANPSPRYISKLVLRLLDKRSASDAQTELSMIGQRAVPALMAALDDERFRRAEWDGFSPAPAPLDAILDLLVPHVPDQVAAAATKLIDSPSDTVRKTAALHLASLGRVETMSALTRALTDADGYVRAYTCIGMRRAVEAGRAGNVFRQRAYELVLEQCDQAWDGPANDAADTAISLDPPRAGRDFASERWWSLAQNPNAHHTIEACNKAGIVLPAAIVRPLFERELRLAVGDDCHPHKYIAAAALESLRFSLGEQARPLLESALDNEQKEIQEAAARGIAALAGVDDPVAFVFAREGEAGFEGLTEPQRVVYCAFLFDAEVCNGGIMQFFGNTSGDHASETLEALRKLGHPEAETALASAMKQIGPLARESNRELRLAAFEDRYDELQAGFEPLQTAYYDTPNSLHRMMLLYAARHAEHFRENGPAC